MLKMLYILWTEFQCGCHIKIQFTQGDWKTANQMKANEERNIYIALQDITIMTDRDVLKAEVMKEETKETLL